MPDPITELKNTADAVESSARYFVNSTSDLGNTAAALIDVKQRASEVRGFTGTNPSNNSGVMESIMGSSLGKMLPKDGAGFLGGLGSQIKKMGSQAPGVTDALAGGAQLFALDKYTKAVEYATKPIKTMQESILKLDKATIQSGVAFGETFGEAQAKVGAYRNAMAESIIDTRSLEAEVLSVQSGLKGAFGADTITPLGELHDANIKANAAMSLTNVALLTSKATGLESAEITRMMSQAHLELGATAGGAALMLGGIAAVAKKSGLSFGSVSKSIMTSADSLKMWGGNVSSVTDTFAAFNASLKEGEKGLSGKLTEDYIRGLQGMQFEMKALIGMQSGFATGGTAIGAGLKTEALIEQGPEGMKELSSNLISTIKQFTGSDMVTREQAIESPELENTFIMQRKLIGQMTGITDAGEATRVIKALQDIDTKGYESVSSAGDALAGLMGTGQMVGEATTTTLDAANLQKAAAQYTIGTKTLEGIKQALIKFDVDKWLSAGRHAIDRGIKEGGIRPSFVSDVISYANNPETMGRVGTRRKQDATASDPSFTENAHAAINDLVAIAKGPDAKAKMNTEIARLRENPTVSQETRLAVFNDALERLVTKRAIPARQAEPHTLRRSELATVRSPVVPLGQERQDVLLNLKVQPLKIPVEVIASGSSVNVNAVVDSENQDHVSAVGNIVTKISKG